MMPWADPRFWLVAAAVVGVGIFAAVEEIRIAALRGEVEQRKAENVAQREAVAALKVQLGEVVTNRDRLQSTIEKQNAKVDALEAAAKAAASAANVRALRALQEGRAAALRVDGGSGPESLNTWLLEAFAP